jgi:hypothetical protein
MLYGVNMIPVLATAIMFFAYIVAALQISKLFTAFGAMHSQLKRKSNNPEKLLDFHTKNI